MIDTGISTAILMAEIAMLFFVVTLAVQLFQARFGAERLRRWMGGRPLPAALKGIGLGFVTPFCTFTAIPLLVGLRQARVPAAGYVAFIVAAPVLDPVLFGALALIAGFETAALYAAVAFVGALGLALVAEAFDLERRLPPVERLLGGPEVGGGAALDHTTGCGRADGDADGGCGDTRPDPAPWRGFAVELGPASRSAGRLLGGMAPILLVGIALSLIIEAAVPPEMAQRVTAANPSAAVPVAAALGTPLYVSTTLFVPLADALQAAGVGIGAIVALTIAGAGANIPEFVILSRLAKPQITGVLAGYVFAVAVAGGLLAQAILA